MKEIKKNSKQTQDSERRSSGGKKIIWIIIFVIVVFCVYFFLIRKSDNTDKSKVESNTTKGNTTEKNIQDGSAKNETTKKIDDKYVGKYVSQIDSAYYRDLKADGTFSVKDGPMKTVGTFRIDSNVITFNYAVGLEASSTISDDIIVDEDREVWKKK